jgi:hypothetical protein
MDYRPSFRKGKYDQEFMGATGMTMARIVETHPLRLFEIVNPGGQMLIPNFAPQLRARGYMEMFMDRTLIYRDEQAMLRLLAQIEPAQIQTYGVYDDPRGSVVYLLVKKGS